MFDAVVFAELNPGVRSVEKFIVSTDESNLPGRMLIFQKGFEINKVLKSIFLLQQQVQMTHTGEIVHIQLKGVVASGSKTNVHMDTVIYSGGTIWHFMKRSFS